MATLMLQRYSDSQNNDRRNHPNSSKLTRIPAQLSLLKEESSHSDIKAVFEHNNSNSSSSSASSNNSSQNDDDDEDESDASTSYESSDWEVRTLISTVSNFMPFKKEAPALKNRLTQQYLIGLDKEQLSSNISYDHHYDLYELFYPFNNMQSLLFSLITPYTHNDYKQNKAFGNNEEDQLEEDQICCQNSMNWNDISSVNKIKDLITNLLASCSEHEGIKEDELYLMFSTPSPNEIIEHLRFGMLSNLCNVHMDRFGRRTYHYRAKQNAHHAEAHFFSDDLRHSMFADADINGLDDFLEEDMTPFMTPAISNRIKQSPHKFPLTAKPSFQCFASINNDNFNGLGYSDDSDDAVDSMDITHHTASPMTPNRKKQMDSMQLSKEWNLKHLRVGSCSPNKLEALDEYMETPPLPIIMSGACMEFGHPVDATFDIDNDDIQLNFLDIVEENDNMISPSKTVTTSASDTSQSSLGSDRSRKVLHKKNDGSLLSILSFKFLTKHINPVCQ